MTSAQTLETAPMSYTAPIAPARPEEANKSHNPNESADTLGTMSKYYTMPTRTPVVSTTSAQMVGQTRTPTALQPPASMTSAQTLETAPMSYTAPIAPARPEEANKSHNPNESADTLVTMSKYYKMPTRTPVVSTTSAQMVGQTRTPKALWRPAPMTSGATVHQHFRTP